MKTSLAKLQGRTRVTIALSALWILISNFIYFEGVGVTRHYSVIDSASNSELPAWQAAWSRLTFGLAVARPYEIISDGFQSGGTMYSTDEYRILGHLLIVILPLLLLWLVHLCLTWVIAGFRNSVE